jgi:hypothetical protein
MGENDKTKLDEEGRPGLYYIDPFTPLTKEQYENFDELLKPRNSSKSAADVSLTKPVDIISKNFDRLFSR